ncbi:Crp/Fnr family transcriptional regulator [Pseudoblastomonas halimionae]|uniref:Cyclic nucleotide-binding domain-containing protein n=1 Tax=Alteriqipengyuania halimionae TaxID=1926630 RepID=A0A6I4U6J3_9SPHN|nr:Crp/Fnr family transcriptional regulator [Alteriqipengyuania halimionae]MXP11034.1 cyclic nucleotide-binding domain-containing protein [Alteriqipengyuania halimionae]
MSRVLQFEATQRSLATPMLFASLDPALRAELVAGSRQRVFADEQIIQQRGDPGDSFWLIEEGAVRIGQFLPDGDFRAVALLGGGDSYGELAVFAGKPRIVDAIARGESRLRLITAGAFLEALARYPASNRALLGALSAQLQDALSLLSGLRRGTNPQRLAGLLATLAGDGVGGATVTITQQELADLLGVTRATANAALGELERRKLVERGYGTIEVPERERLAVFALG